MSIRQRAQKMGIILLGVVDYFRYFLAVYRS
jgi:hypothetical protein